MFCQIRIFSSSVIFPAGRLFYSPSFFLIRVSSSAAHFPASNPNAMSLSLLFAANRSTDVFSSCCFQNLGQHNLIAFWKTLSVSKGIFSLILVNGLWAKKNTVRKKNKREKSKYKPSLHFVTLSDFRWIIRSANDSFCFEKYSQHFI